MDTITRKQADIMRGFYAHIASVNFDGAKPDYGFYALHMDNAGIPWRIQNTIAGEAENRDNVFGRYFSSVLKNNNILIK